jgi:hypothetical protein
MEEVPDFETCFHKVTHVAMMKAQYCPKDLQIGQQGHEMHLDCFSCQPQQFPYANLRTLRLYLTNYGKHWDRNVARCPIRCRKIQDFASVIANVPNLENLRLYVKQIWYCFEVLHQTENIHRDIFHCLATGCQLDGLPLGLPGDGPLLPRLQSLELSGFHAIKPDLLVHFCRERRNSLRRVDLMDIWDSERQNPKNLERRIRDAISASPEDSLDIRVDEESCYDGFINEF